MALEGEFAFLFAHGTSASFKMVTCELKVVEACSCHLFALGYLHGSNEAARISAVVCTCLLLDFPGVWRDIGMNYRLDASCDCMAEKVVEIIRLCMGCILSRSLVLGAPW